MHAYDAAHHLSASPLTQQELFDFKSDPGLQTLEQHKEAAGEALFASCVKAGGGRYLRNANDGNAIDGVLQLQEVSK